MLIVYKKTHNNATSNFNPVHDVIRHDIDKKSWK